MTAANWIFLFDRFSWARVKYCAAPQPSGWLTSFFPMLSSRRTEKAAESLWSLQWLFLVYVCLSVTWQQLQPFTSIFFSFGDRISFPSLKDWLVSSNSSTTMLIVAFFSCSRLAASNWMTNDSAESSAPSLNAAQQARGSLLQCLGTWKTKRLFSSPRSACVSVCVCVCVCACPAVFVLWQTDFIAAFPVYHQRCISRTSQVLWSLSLRRRHHQSSAPWRAFEQRLKGQFAEFSHLLGHLEVNLRITAPCVCVCLKCEHWPSHFSSLGFRLAKVRLDEQKQIKQTQTTSNSCVLNTSTLSLSLPFTSSKKY